MHAFRYLFVRPLWKSIKRTIAVWWSFCLSVESYSGGGGGGGNTVGCAANVPCYNSKCTARKLTTGPPERDSCGGYQASVQGEKWVPSAYSITYICNHSGNAPMRGSRMRVAKVFTISLHFHANIQHCLCSNFFSEIEHEKNIRSLRKHVQIMFNECVAFTWAMRDLVEGRTWANRTGWCV